MGGGTLGGQTWGTNFHGKGGERVRWCDLNWEGPDIRIPGFGYPVKAGGLARLQGFTLGAIRT